MLSPFAKWILFLMLLLQPNAPWKNTYEKTAEAIADVSVRRPVFDSNGGSNQTAVLLVSLAWFESRFDPNAIGDHGKSFGLYQQQGMGKLPDPVVATNVAVDQIKISFRVCSNKPVNDRLAWYAAGRDACTDAGGEKGVRESRHRMLKAKELWAKHPFKEE